MCNIFANFHRCYQHCKKKNPTSYYTYLTTFNTSLICFYTRLLSFLCKHCLQFILKFSEFLSHCCWSQLSHWQLHFCRIFCFSQNVSSAICIFLLNLQLRCSVRGSNWMTDHRWVFQGLPESWKSIDFFQFSQFLALTNGVKLVIFLKGGFALRGEFKFLPKFEFCSSNAAPILVELALLHWKLCKV